jgi:hypothetical protein
MNKVMHSISRLIWDSDLIGSRFVLALAEMLWAVMLLWPGDTFARPTYAMMATVMSEHAWAALFFISATTQATIIVQEDFHSKFARYFAGFNTCLWCFVVTSMLLSVYPPPAAIAGEIAIAASASWVWVRPYLLVEGYKRAGF